jgi:hypothetical protein
MTLTCIMARPVVLHFDLNKTILACDDAKGYGFKEVVYLEQWRRDEAFLEWAFKQYGQDQEYESWRKNFQASVNEPNLVEAARTYVSQDAGREEKMSALFSQFHSDNSVQSFWNLLQWIKENDELEVMIVFRSFGTELLHMFEKVRDHGFGDAIIRDAQGQPMVWTVLHKQMNDFSYHDLDIVGEYLQPGNPVPGPKQRHEPEFKERTISLEDHAQENYAAGKFLEPVLYTGPQARDPLSMYLKPLVDISKDYLHDINEMPSLFLEQINRNKSTKLTIMGIQDNYKPWSRKNPLNAKPFIFDTALHQIFFDDYIFSKSEAMGTYIVSLYENGNQIVYDRQDAKSQLQKKYSADVVTSETPCLSRVVINQGGQSNTAASNPEYFVDKLSSILSSNQRSMPVTEEL